MPRLIDLVEGFPRRFAESSAYAAAKALVDPQLAWIRNQWCGYSNLLVVGPSGCGKSVTLASAIRRVAFDWFDRGLSRKVVWMPAGELVKTTRRDSILRAKRAYLLVLDDVTWTRERGIVLEILAHRYDANRATASTAGVSCADLVRRLGDAGLRRMTEGGRVIDLWRRADPVSAQKPSPKQLPLGGVEVSHAR